MRVDDFGQLIFTETDLMDLYLEDPDRIINDIILENDIDFDKNLDINNKPKTILYTIPEEISKEEFDNNKQSFWYMPDSYKNMDIAKFVLDQCSNDEELQRAGQELLLYQKYDLFNLLKYIKYLVDTMREHNIVWGVGRGSSVASFVLYLIGLHKINSLYFDLDIEEFLK
jgi:DNA polymerase III alpha subunit